MMARSPAKGPDLSTMSCRSLLLPLLLVAAGCSSVRPAAEDAPAGEPQFAITATVTPLHTAWIRIEPEREAYAPGEVVSILTEPRGRFLFDRWGGDLDESAPNPILRHRMDGDLNVVAHLAGGHLADRPLLSPLQNTYYMEAPRDLYFAVHPGPNRLLKVEANGQTVEHTREPVGNRESVGQPVPGSEMIRLDRAIVEALGTGLHEIAFRFSDDRVLTSGLSIVAPGEGRVFDMNIIGFFVDHGDCLFIELPNGETMMLDTGTLEHNERYVIPFLKRHLPVREDGRQRIDHIFITHWHYDHFQGLIALLREFEVGQVRFNMDVPPNEWGDYDAYPDPNDPYGFAAFGVSTGHWEEFRVGNVLTGIGGDDVSVEILNAAAFDEHDPRFGLYHREYYEQWFNRNNRSLSIRLQYGDFVLSAGGDTYQHAQRAVLSAFGEERVRSHIFHANHHFHGGVETDYLVATDPVLFVTSANEAVYDREAYTRNVLNEAIPALKSRGGRFVENLLSFELGHVVIRIDGSADWSSGTTRIPYESYFINPFHYEEHTVPYLHGSRPMEAAAARPGAGSN
jgi:glyoxylase-like metal-dependent hydrolase (beta-lactamase superfamily II)